jgi:hypothetical protein
VWLWPQLGGEQEQHRRGPERPGNYQDERVARVPDVERITSLGGSPGGAPPVLVAPEKHAPDERCDAQNQ